jgi:hypothetical protein
MEMLNRIYNYFSPGVVPHTHVEDAPPLQVIVSPLTREVSSPFSRDKRTIVSPHTVLQMQLLQASDQKLADRSRLALAILHLVELDKLDSLDMTSGTFTLIAMLPDEKLPLARQLIENTQQ